jgi:hypothetical protein
VSAAEKAMSSIGWRLAATAPIYASFHFERFVGRRRVAGAIVFANTTAKAWTKLRKLYKENAPEDAA